MGIKGAYVANRQKCKVKGLCVARLTGSSRCSSIAYLRYEMDLCGYMTYTSIVMTRKSKNSLRTCEQN